MLNENYLSIDVLYLCYIEIKYIPIGSTELKKRYSLWNVSFQKGKKICSLKYTFLKYIINFNL